MLLLTTLGTCFLALSVVAADDMTNLAEAVSQCYNSSCYPRWGNLLKGRRVSADSTCGQDGPEEYCLVSNERRDTTCGTCDQSNKYKQHPPNYMKDRRIKSRTTWWKAVNGQEDVILQLDLETTFQFTHLMMVFYTFRPRAMVIERSTDYGITWMPYQYFAYNCQKAFGMQERELGEPDEYGVQRHPDEDVICTSKYSQIEPAQGGEVIYKVIRGRPTANANRVSLRKLLLLTNLRIRFVKLHTLGDEIFRDLPNDEQAKKQYFYAVEDWVVRGSCFCNGHADECEPMPGMDDSEKIRNMITGKCVCQHNTDGYNCERCMDLYHTQPWMPGDQASGEAHACQECNCNGHSDICQFDEQLYAQTGDGGRCTECGDSTAGPHCEQCVYGYYQIDGLPLTDTGICQPCNCNEAGTTSEICASVASEGVDAGTCICKFNVEQSAKCDTCKPDHYDIDPENTLGCTACGCDTRGTVDNATSCDSVEGQCVCKETVEGQACDRCKVGYFNMKSDSQVGCEQCGCDSPGAANPDECDPLTGACFCKTGFTGYSCDEIEPGYFVPALDHWKYNPEDSGTIDSKGTIEKAANSSGTGYVVLPVDSSLEQNTDEREGADDDDELDNLEMLLDTGYYDIKIFHDPAESDYELTIELDHMGKFDGTEPSPYTCTAGDEEVTEEPFAKQTITITIKAGSSVTRLEDFCVDQGSQYNINIALEDSGTGALVIRDMLIVKPVEPEKAFSQHPSLENMYREYQELGCPLEDGFVGDVPNDCFRLKNQIEGVVRPEVTEPCKVSVCLPVVDIWDFTEDKDDISLGGGAEVEVKEGGTVRLPVNSDMTVPIDPGTGGFKDVILTHDPVAEPMEIEVTIKHTGNKDGSDPASYKCTNEIVRPYSQTTLTVTVDNDTKFTSLGGFCFDPDGTYIISISPTSGYDLVLDEILFALPDFGDLAFPESPELADLWDEYIAERCPKVAGGENSDKQECIDLINRINEIKAKGDDAKDCVKDSCIPYNPLWKPYDPLDDLSGGSYIDPEAGSMVLPDSDSVVEVPVSGSDGVTGAVTDLVVKHDPVSEPQKLIVELVRTDSDEPYTCGALQDVPVTQQVEVTILPGTESTIVSSFCMDPEGDYELRVVGDDTSEPVKINEIGSALPANSDTAFPDNPEAATEYEKFQETGCEVYPSEDASAECKYLANLVDYLSDPERTGTKDCSVELCYPSNDVFGPGDEAALCDGAAVDSSDGSIDIPSGGKAVFDVEPLITGPNTVVIEYDSEDPPSSITVKLVYKGQKDGSNINEFQCRGETVKPGDTMRVVELDTSPVEFEECLVHDGVYELEVIVEEEEEEMSIDVNKIYVELPRDTDNIFGDSVAASADILDKILSECVEKEFTAECAAASHELADIIDDINESYKVDCSKELCLPENNLWSEGDVFWGKDNAVTEGGAVVLPNGEASITIPFKGSDAPKEGLNSLIITVNVADYKRVVDIIITPINPEAGGDHVTCEDVSSNKEQLLRKVIQEGIRFLEVGPVCLDPDLDYQVELVYKGVQPPNTDKIYSDTSGITVVVDSVDVVMPVDPEDAFPDNQVAADIWEEYVQAQCPRLRAGYRDASQDCLDLLGDLHKEMGTVEEPECAGTVCIETEGGWKHDPTSEEEVYDNGAVVSGASEEAAIVIPPGGDVSIKTGDKETAVPAENIPISGLMDVLITHKLSRYAWEISVEVTHTKTKGEVIPAEYSCGDVTLQPYSSQVFEAEAPACSTQTRIPGVCVNKDNTYKIKVTVLSRIEPEEECEGAVETDSGFPLDEVMFTFPEDPAVAFPDSPELQELYGDYISKACPGVRSEECDELSVDIITKIVGQSVGCGCDLRGSTSNTCDPVGGQCTCKEGYTGRTCNLCDVAFYGIVDEYDAWTGVCIPCNCNEYGSSSEICDDEGQCPCYDGVATTDSLPGLTDCSQCLPGFVGLDNLAMMGCVKCECGVGAAAPNCDESTGSCSCLPGVAEPLCNDCSTGFYDLSTDSGCTACGCNRGGSQGLGCDQETGVCTCKENVVGTKCDACKTGTFSISEENPVGCVPCYCNGISDQCTAASGWALTSDSIHKDLKWMVVGGGTEERKSYWVGGAKGTEFVWRAKKVGNFYTSYGLLLTVEISGATDQEVLLRLYRDDVYITATLNQDSAKSFSVSLFETNFETQNAPATFEVVRYVLGDVSQVEITTLYDDAVRHDQKMKGLVIVSPVEGAEGDPAGNVELCLCPDNYTGHACQSCREGYAKDFTSGPDAVVTFTCVECSAMCNGNSDECDPESGQCSNCLNNYAGDQCETCLEGYYPNAEGDVEMCLPCPCTQNAASPSCSIGLGDGGEYPVCDACEKGYTGANCTDCAPGYFGADGHCTACECNGNIDQSDVYSCSREDGVCQICLYNTTGDECEKCLDGFYGNAQKPDLPKCRACGCDPVGAPSNICDGFSGQCECLPHVGDSRCDKCTDGYWNMTEEIGCSPCVCDPKGSVSVECDALTGQCQCKDGIEGIECDKCVAGYYNTNSDSSTEFECTPCGCNMDGSTSEQCDNTGQCMCKEGITGMQCDQCNRGTTGEFPSCEPCGACYDKWEDEVTKLEDAIEQLAAKAQNVHLGAANLTEDQLESIFKEIRQTLREAEKLAVLSLGDSDAITAMTQTLVDMAHALQEKSDELDLLKERLDNIDTSTNETLGSLDDLEKQLEDFRVYTNNLADKAMNLSAANLDEALKLVEDASERSISAKEKATATVAHIEEAEARSKKAEKILKDPIFDDTTSVETLANIQVDLVDLSAKMDVLDQTVCGSELDSCEPCGGSQCGTCGGPGCGGAVGIISSITQLADEARTCTDDRQKEVTEATSELRQLTADADDTQEIVDEMKEVSEATKQGLAEMEDKLKEVKTKMDQLIGDDRTTAEQVDAIIAATSALELPLSEADLDKLIADLLQALDEINLVNTDLDVSLPDKQRVADLLARAQVASENANSTLEAILEATFVLREFDENYSAAEQLLADTSEVVNEGWAGINQIAKNAADADEYRDGLDKAIEALELELNLLLADIGTGDDIAQLAQDKIDEATATVQQNEQDVQRLKKDYDELDDVITEKEELISEQVVETRRGAELSEQVEASINSKIEEVEVLTEKYITQQSTLVDLNSELDELESTLDGLMIEIKEKATYHAVCNTDTPSK